MAFWKNPLEYLHAFAGNNVCADCSEANPAWASLNLGVLVCDECCSVHRSLGNVVSQICSIEYHPWTMPQLEMMGFLGNNYTNSIWEATRDVEKPTPNDSVTPIKLQYITSKYKLSSFRPQDAVSLDHSTLFYSVMAYDLKSTFFCLCMGIDPNQQQPLSFRTPLHYAALAGDKLVVEMLLIHGADPTMTDSNDLKPSDLARQNGFYQIASRLLFAECELFNKLQSFRHQHRQLIVHETEEARQQVRLMNDIEFSNMSIDVYDETVRRVVEESWIKVHGHSHNKESRALLLPFLPVTMMLTATRQQSRQKLAVLTEERFVTLIDCVLKEAHYRETGQHEPEMMVMMQQQQQQQKQQQQQQQQQQQLQSSNSGPQSTSKLVPLSNDSQSENQSESVVQSLVEEIKSMRRSQSTMHEKILSLERENTSLMLITRANIGIKDNNSTQSCTDALAKISETISQSAKISDYQAFLTGCQNLSIVIKDLENSITDPSSSFLSSITNLKNTQIDAIRVGENHQPLVQASSLIAKFTYAVLESLNVDIAL